MLGVGNSQWLDLMYDSEIINMYVNKLFIESVSGLSSSNYNSVYKSMNNNGSASSGGRRQTPSRSQQATELQVINQQQRNGGARSAGMQHKDSKTNKRERCIIS